MYVMWITFFARGMSDLYYLICGLNHTRHAVLGLDFWTFVWQYSTIRKSRKVLDKKGSKMNTIEKNEALAQTPEQTLADYARLDALIAKGTYSDK